VNCTSIQGKGQTCEFSNFKTLLVRNDGLHVSKPPSNR
jgi:hypothetical protein